MIHHESFPVEGGSEEEAYDVIETDGEILVSSGGMSGTPYDTLAEAIAAAKSMAAAAAKRIVDAKRRARREAGEQKRLKAKALEIADLTCLHINQFKGKFPATRYATQQLLEEVIAILEQRV